MQHVPSEDDEQDDMNESVNVGREEEENLPSAREPSSPEQDEAQSAPQSTVPRNF